MEKAFLEITLKVDESNRANVFAGYNHYREIFFKTVKGGLSKDLLIRNEDLQVLLSFDTKENAVAYINSYLFTNDVVNHLKPFLAAPPDVRIYNMM